MNRLLESPVDYYLCATKKRFKKYLKRLRIDKRLWPDFTLNKQSNATTHFFENNSTGKTAALVCIGGTDDATDIQVMSLIVHEAVHVWQEIKDNIGEKYPSTEFEAYAIQVISQSLMCEWKDQNK